MGRSVKSIWALGLASTLAQPKPAPMTLGDTRLEAPFKEEMTTLARAICAYLAFVAWTLFVHFVPAAAIPFLIGTAIVAVVFVGIIAVEGE